MTRFIKAFLRVTLMASVIGVFLLSVPGVSWGGEPSKGEQAAEEAAKLACKLRKDEKACLERIEQVKCALHPERCAEEKLSPVTSVGFGPRDLIGRDLDHFAVIFMMTAAVLYFSCFKWQKMSRTGWAARILGSYVVGVISGLAYEIGQKAPRDSAFAHLRGVWALALGLAILGLLLHWRWFPWFVQARRLGIVGRFLRTGEDPNDLAGNTKEEEVPKADEVPTGTDSAAEEQSSAESKPTTLKLPCCSKCGTENMADAEYCEGCGEKLESNPATPLPSRAPVSAKTCAECGAARFDGDFCDQCGNP